MDGGELARIEGDSVEYLETDRGDTRGGALEMVEGKKTQDWGFLYVMVFR